MDENTEEPQEDTRTALERLTDALQKGQAVTLQGVIAAKPSAAWVEISVLGYGRIQMRAHRVLEMLDDGRLTPGKAVPLKRYERVYIKGLPRKPENRVMVMEPETEDGVVLVHLPGQMELSLRSADNYVR